MHCKMTSPTPSPGLKDEKYENFSLHENSCNNFSVIFRRGACYVCRESKAAARRQAIE